MLPGICVRAYRVAAAGAFGVYYVQFLEYFDVSHAAASWMRTIEQIFILIAGELSQISIQHSTDSEFLLRY